jgi:hypothetical protein
LVYAFPSNANIPLPEVFPLETWYKMTVRLYPSFHNNSNDFLDSHCL